MLKRLFRVSLSIFAFAVIIFALTIVASIIGARFHPDGTFDIYNLSNDPQVPSECRRHVGDFTINSEEDGDYLDYQWQGTQAQLDRCIEAINAMSETFNERDYVGSYEAGYVAWVGFDPTDIRDWDLPDECQPHYVFNSKSHPWWIDYMGTVDYIDVTFEWVGTDTEWEACSVSREKQIAEIDPAEIETTWVGEPISGSITGFTFTVITTEQ